MGTLPMLYQLRAWILPTEGLAHVVKLTTEYFNAENTVGMGQGNAKLVDAC